MNPAVIVALLGAGGVGGLVITVSSYFLRRLGWIPTSPTEEAAIARADRAEKELEKAHHRLGELEQTRSLRPVLILLRDAAQAQAQVIEKLTAFNGSMAAQKQALDETRESLQETREGLEAAVDSIKFVTGLVLSVADIDVPPKLKEHGIDKPPVGREERRQSW